MPPTAYPQTFADPFAAPREDAAPRYTVRSIVVTATIVLAVALILAGTVYGLTLPVHQW